MHFITVKIPISIPYWFGFDWPWTSLSFLNSKTYLFALWWCPLRLWNNLCLASMLFSDCFTVSMPVHMDNAQPKWNGASTAVVESMKTTSMETVSTGVLDQNKEHYIRSKDKAEKSYDVSRHTIAYVQPKNRMMYQDIQLPMSQLLLISKKWTNIQEVSG